MQVVRSSNIHNFDSWIFNDSSPICRLLLKTKSTPSRTGSGFDVIGTNNEFGMKRTLRKTLDDLAVGSAVHFTHPTHANDANSYDTWHSLWSPVVIKRFQSASAR